MNRRVSWGLLLISILCGCTVGRLGRSIYLTNSYLAFEQGLSRAVGAFDTDPPLHAVCQGVDGLWWSSYYMYDGRKMAEAEIKSALNISEEYLKALQKRGVKQVSSHDLFVWKGRMKLLLLLGDMARLEEECLYCLSVYDVPDLRCSAYRYLMISLSAQGKVSEAEMVWDEYLPQCNLRLGDDDFNRLFSLYLEQKRGRVSEALEGLSLILRDCNVPDAQRILLWRRLVDLAKVEGEESLVLAGLKELSAHYHRRPIHRLEVELEMWALGEGDPSLAKRAQSWLAQSSGGDCLRAEISRKLRNMAYDEGDLYQACLLNEQLSKLGFSGQTSIETFNDSLRYEYINRIKEDLRLIKKYETSDEKRNLDTSPQLSDDQTSTFSLLGFRTLWGDVANQDFWAMSSDRLAFVDGQDFSVESGNFLSVERYQTSLIRVALVCLDYLLAPDKARVYLKKCISIDSKSREGEYANRLLSDSQGRDTLSDAS